MVALWLAVAFCQPSSAAPQQAGLLTSEFIFASNPVRSCHASTIVEAKDKSLVAAWFAGSAEGKPDVSIWSARCVAGRWTTPAKVAEDVTADGKREPCWNPVLFQPREGKLMLFYKSGPWPGAWRGMLQTSDDNGQTWGEARPLPDGILGPIKNKPVQLADGSILCGSSVEAFKTPPFWRIHFERTTDNGLSWSSSEAPQPAASPPAIQPSILFLGHGKLMAVGRSRVGRIFATTSADNGLTWSKLALLDLPNPNSGTDAVTLKDGRQLLVYNNATKGRSPLNLAVSGDGRTWNAALVLEDEPNAEFSYPAIIQTSDGLVHVTYTWKRQLIRHIVIDPAKLVTRPFINGEWPKP
jgi:predicted neuraminidase